MIGLFCGDSKPDDLDSYLYDIIEEMKGIKTEGIKISKSTIRISISCFIRDALARAFLK